ncbi:helix-turn-helix transcriptional regulator [Phormidium sp. FACHB-592]|uniref:Helix-turn-helix domain-containing protein n=1 Tax=Stenomitos frigidus AS-A4 TaxID=2933935 RepID=A0ABV0KSE2_9CYAN|nr:helix-turn-helix transcriptional regulator [Phormidium sp. FACHB-592]MBD2077210.1 helix-turn-helix transcriptional regulator [Phormidium sp. FACHB-592]
MDEAGSLIRTARKLKHLSQRALAKQTGIDFTYVSKIEKGKLEYAPKAAVLAKLAACLELDLCELKRLYGQPLTEWLPSTVFLPDYVG